MDFKPNIEEVSAEMLLACLYPEKGDEWIARLKGTFYRNYSSDLLSVDEEGGVANLARDGLLKLLPQGMLTTEEELKVQDVKGRGEAVHNRVQVLREALLPLDTFFFRRSLKLEKQISDLSDSRMDFVLEHFFGIRLSPDTDAYIRKAVWLLPRIREIRGNMGFVRALMENVLDCPVEMKQGRYSATDTTETFLPMVQYNLLIPGLDAALYRAKAEEIKPFCNFLLEWFVPVDVMCRFGIKQRGGHFGTEQGIVLDYNIVID